MTKEAANTLALANLTEEIANLTAREAAIVKLPLAKRSDARRLLNEDMMFAHEKRAQLYASQNRWQEAREDYEKTAAYARQGDGRPRDREAELHFLTANCDYQLRHFAQASQDLAKAKNAFGWDAAKIDERNLTITAKVHLASENFGAAIEASTAIRNAVGVLVQNLKKEYPTRNFDDAFKRELQTSYTLEATALYLRGDYEAAVAKWRELTPINPELAKMNLFDWVQAPLNAAIAQNQQDPEARLRRAQYFQARADQQRVPGATVNSGGLFNLIELQNIQPYTFDEAALFDLDKLIELRPSPRAYKSRADSATAFNKTAPEWRKIPDAQIGSDRNFATKTE
jgi:hypothetical protein